MLASSEGMSGVHGLIPGKLSRLLAIFEEGLVLHSVGELLDLKNLILLLAQPTLSRVSPLILLLSYHDPSKSKLLLLPGHCRLNIATRVQIRLRAHRSINKCSMRLPELIHRLQNIIVKVVNAEIFGTFADSDS